MKFFGWLTWLQLVVRLNTKDIMRRRNFNAWAGTACVLCDEGDMKTEITFCWVANSPKIAGQPFTLFGQMMRTHTSEKCSYKASFQQPLFWNSRGLSDFAKTRFLRESSIEHDLTFIALLETGKQDFSQGSLNNFSGGKNFVWHWTAPRGRSGGMLLGVNIDRLDVGSIEDGDFFVKFRVRDRRSDFKWVLVAVYGAAQPEFKESFLTELVQACREESLPTFIFFTGNIV
jgi:hypothetical protein